MTRFAIIAPAVIVIMLASVPTRGAEPFKRFSLLAATAEPTDCLLRSGSLTDHPEGGCVLLTVPPLVEFSGLPPTRTAPATRPEEPGVPRGDGLDTGSFVLSHNWSAGLAYHHERLSPTATSRDLRTRRFSLFSAEESRDVIDLRLSWRVSQLSALDFGYQVQSNRASLAAAAESYSVRRFVSDADLDYALTIGITRRFNTGQ